MRLWVINFDILFDRFHFLDRDLLLKIWGTDLNFFGEFPFNSICLLRLEVLWRFYWLLSKRLILHHIRTIDHLDNFTIRLFNMKMYAPLSLSFRLERYDLLFRYSLLEMSPLLPGSYPLIVNVAGE